jgi:hypothetical protein
MLPGNANAGQMPEKTEAAIKVILRIIAGVLAFQMLFWSFSMRCFLLKTDPTK